MKAVNAATQAIVDLFYKRAEQIPFEAHPYSALIQAQKKLGETEWTDENKGAALAAMHLWVSQVLGDSGADTLNSILACMRAAADNGDEGKKAAQEMSKSMSFLEKVVTVFLNEVDIDHVSEMMFEDGVRREKAAAAATSTSPPDTAPKKPIQNWTPARWAPSVN